jgi:hypothetical protein
MTALLQVAAEWLGNGASANDDGIWSLEFGRGVAAFRSGNDLAGFLMTTLVEREHWARFGKEDDRYWSKVLASFRLQELPPQPTLLDAVLAVIAQIQVKEKQP